MQHECQVMQRAGLLLDWPNDGSPGGVVKRYSGQIARHRLLRRSSDDEEDYE